MTITSPATPAPARKPRKRSTRLTRSDRVWLTVLLGVPTLVVVGLVWLPALATVGLSLTNWDGFQPLRQAKFVGLHNYEQVATNYPPFWPALQHNLLWLFVTFAIPTLLGMFIAVLLD